MPKHTTIQTYHTVGLQVLIAYLIHFCNFFISLQQKGLSTQYHKQFHQVSTKYKNITFLHLQKLMEKHRISINSGNVHAQRKKHTLLGMKFHSIPLYSFWILSITQPGKKKSLEFIWKLINHHQLYFRCKILERNMGAHNEVLDTEALPFNI